MLENNERPVDMTDEWLAGFNAACELLIKDMDEDRYGIGNMCSMWTAADIGDDMKQRVMEAWDARKRH